MAAQSGANLKAHDNDCKPSTSAEKKAFYLLFFRFMFVLLSKRNLRNYLISFMRFGINIITAFLRILFVGVLFLNWILSGEAVDMQPYL